MRILFPLIFAVVFILLLGLIEILLLRFLNKPWWEKRFIKWLAIFLPVSGVVMILAWGLGEYYAKNWLLYPGAVGTSLIFILEVGLMLSLPVSGVIHITDKVFDWVAKKRGRDSDRQIDTSRRNILKTAAAVVPAVTLGMGVSGITCAFSDVRIYLKTIHFANLPPALNGLRIFHLSDLHLHNYVTLDDLEEIVVRGKSFNPDLVLVTGDIADDLKLLPGAINLINGIKAPLGAYACLGNHEYFRGITEIKREFERSPIPLLINEGVKLSLDNESLYIVAIDDPRHLSGGNKEFFQRTIDTAMTGVTGDDFIVLMSHRPEAFDYASEAGIALTLAGHTHGGQIGINGRSCFESVWPEHYLWGYYNTGDSHLYTSSGVGHWFPFRMGCPPEAPVIELRKS